MTRVGVAGLGFGATVHVPALRSIEGVDIVAIAGRDAVRSASVATDLGIGRSVTSIEALLDLGLDAVLIALPPDAGEAAVAAALASGVAVLAEKPLARSAAAAWALTEAAHGMTAAVDFELPELLTFRSLRQALADGVAGAPHELAVTWRMRSRAHETREWSWKTDVDRGGGVLSLLGVHVVHLTEWLLGDSIAQVSAVTDASRTASFAPRGARPAPHAASVRACMRSGLQVTIEIDNASDAPSLHEWRITGEDGSLVAANTTRDTVHGFALWRNETDRRELLVTEPVDGDDGRLAPVRAVVTRFLTSVRAGEPATPGFDEAARAQVVLDAVQLSAATDGSAVEL